MAEAVRLANADVAAADARLDERVTALNESGKMLSERMSGLDKLTTEANSRAAAVSTALTAIEDKMDRASRMIDQAMKASSMAASAASDTGDALNEAVMNALDQTKDASGFIRKQAREAVDDALSAMRELREAGEQALASTVSAGKAAREQADETEVRIHKINEMIYRSATRSTAAAEAGLERARLRIERASEYLNAADDGESLVVPKLTGEPTTDRQTKEKSLLAPPEPVSPSGGRGLFRGSKAVASTAQIPSAESDIDEEPAQKPIANDNPDRLPAEGRLSWKDLLAGLEEDVPGERDATAKAILSRIEDEGIGLVDLISATDASRIEAASRKGDRLRRRVVREVTGKRVEALAETLSADAGFEDLSRIFVSDEEEDAVRALAKSSKSKTALSSRLTAWLLLETAIVRDDP